MILIKFDQSICPKLITKFHQQTRTGAWIKEGMVLQKTQYLFVISVTEHQMTFLRLNKTAVSYIHPEH